MIVSFVGTLFQSPDFLGYCRLLKSKTRRRLSQAGKVEPNIGRPVLNGRCAGCNPTPRSVRLRHSHADAQIGRDTDVAIVGGSAGFEILQEIPNHRFLWARLTVSSGPRGRHRRRKNAPASRDRVMRNSMIGKTAAAIVPKATLERTEDLRPGVPI